ncbi:uncharacterized protein PAC_06170 [Phialocephala subalpina]|uniref:Uncharacterized protein n=1 Tax=Phialocephala subalpina TaxID=576137 RepID=A0A1L7WU34_9HELO|nr:uncharacterized protein PAC_06170 [Phialocephala subalpina]
MKYALTFLALASAVTAIAVPKKAIDAATADSIIASSAVPSVANSVQPVAASVPSVAASITSVAASAPSVVASVSSGVDSALSVAAPASSDQAATTSIPSPAASTSASGSASLAAASISPTTVPAPSNAALTSSAGASASTTVDSVLSVAVPSSAPSSLASVAASAPIANKAAAIVPEAQAQAPSAQAPSAQYPPAQAPASVAPAVSTPAISTPAVAAPLATTTVISYLPPLSKSEVNEQHKSYVHAKFVPESAASQVIQALKTQGIVVPSAVVPFQSQQTEVRHSGVENIVEFIEKADYHANPDVEAHPEGGNYYLKYFKGTSPKIADDYAKDNNAYLPLSIFNPSKTDMCIFGGATDLVTGKVTPFAKEGSKSGLTPLAANSTVQFGNYIHLNNVNGRIQALFGCDKECNNCAGAKEGPIHTLFEFMHADHAPGQQVHSWFNPSNVFNDDAICKRRACHSTPKEMKKTCPEKSLWHDKGIYGCKSECKVTGRDDHCCVGAFGLPTTCAASSGFLHELCTDAYSWPYDDKEHTDTCEEEGYPVWNSS